jgi:capsular polysaccharide transport system ATP-binding protein
MIKLRNLSKAFVLGKSRKVVADNINMTFPTGESVGLLGRNGTGKSTLLSMIAGSTEIDRGTIESTGTISWPVGFRGSFHNDLTGGQNTRFVARVYGVDTDELLDFVEDFAELGEHFHLPVRTYSSGMRSRLSFGLSMGIHFDTYLVDEVTSVGDASFRQKSANVFMERLKYSGAVVVTHSTAQIRRLCTSTAVLENGKLTYFRSVDEGIAKHLENLNVREDEDMLMDDGE